MASSSESEMRQRKGKQETAVAEKPMTDEEKVRMFQEKMRAAVEEKVRGEAKPDTPESEIQAAINSGVAQLWGPKKKPLPGLKNETKAAKEALAEDPYNLDKICELGEAYIVEEKWPEAANVLIRGWKRVSEFKEPERQFAYLWHLCRASTECEKHKQALAVLMDMEEPKDVESLKDYCRVSCKVHANTDNMQKSLQAFNKGIAACKEFDEALPIWMDTVMALKKVGAYDAARVALERMAKGDDDKQKMKVMESVTALKATMNSTPTPSTAFTFAYRGMICAFVCITIGALYWLESRSLVALKIQS